jgi:hypothetical protein
MGHFDDFRVGLLEMLDDLQGTLEDCRERKRRRERKRKPRRGKPWVVFLPGGNPAYTDYGGGANPGDPDGSPRDFGRGDD